MKTYLVKAKTQQGFEFIAVKSENKSKAYNEVKSTYPNAQKCVLISSCDISLINGKKI